jgi:glycosyltransferase involved in cell wall biosynthesis
VPYKDLMWDTPIRAAPMRAMWDEHAAAKAFEHYYKNRDVLEEHSKNARAYAVKHYDWNNSIAPKWKKWLKTVRV